MSRLSTLPDGIGFFYGVPLVDEGDNRQLNVRKEGDCWFAYVEDVSPRSGPHASRDEAEAGGVAWMRGNRDIKEDSP